MSIRVNGKTVASVGKDGKSAYEYAVDGGFKGTEAEFQSLMAQAQNLDGGPFLPLSGGTMTGNINVSSQKIQNINRLEFQNKNSFESQTGDPPNIQVLNGGFLFKKGFYETTIDISDPVNDNNAATKRYVDSSIQQAILDSWEKAY